MTEYFYYDLVYNGRKYTLEASSIKDAMAYALDLIAALEFEREMNAQLTEELERKENKK